MRSFQPKRGFRNILHSRPVLVFLGFLVLAFAWGVLRFMTKMLETKENMRIAQSKVDQLEKEKEKLSLDIAKLNTDQGVEESIREKFGLVKEGEGIVIIAPDKNRIETQEIKPRGFLSSLFFWENWFK